ncbi:glucose-6-phosphate dehydrogenase [Sphingomonas sp. CGMCC 1.13654]|uniref:Glucose-6-phosphate 1-dehydrogenase n=1 Tax=Sphingomonas chungangi TaxID=2683589 RepID=A0A838L540_9SPHN|nr:glucose-6-phosphate dehydrogenase [Sphingomonas chungangi]MBA2933316.1 glucose-6-phosphate dehydrogenase [Sphingomonas chungangi]MVW54650.1 glucose-6-phosphate dehydrogenase [Sphingomonas chungangi]
MLKARKKAPKTVKAGEPAPAATLVIFGGVGDLSRRLLTPALVNLTRDGLIGADLSIVVVSRGPDAQFEKELEEHLDLADKPTKTAWATRCKKLSYYQGEFDDPATFEGLAKQLSGNVAFYLATAASFFGPVAQSLAKAGLLKETEGFRRVVVEKPFGHDLASAKALNKTLLSVMDETQIFRIDHFLGKETVQNIMVARFGNAFLEAVWNARYIDHVEITAAETVDVGTRGAFYDATGAMRDMVPNHLFQLLAMVGMEPPNSFDAEAVRNEKVKLLQAVRVPTPKEAKVDAVRGRYAGGTIAGKKVVPYLKAADVAKGSTTETYVAMKLMVDSWRWAGVPFYLRTGKALAARDTEIVIQFKPIALAMFRNTDISKIPPNKLVIQIQPNEGLDLHFNAKVPGPVVDTKEVCMAFRYADNFDLGHRTGYETLLYDVLIGDQSLFQRADQVERGWQIVQPILNAWDKGGEPEDYEAGSEGPAGADALLERDGRTWHPVA